jgi:hypothetical protein
LIEINQWHGPARIACNECEREDYDGATLDQAVADGWEDICFYQSWEDSAKTYDNPDDAPPHYSVLDWYTHCGLCPDCKREELEEQGGA